MTPEATGPVTGFDGGHRDRAELEHLLLHALADAGCPPPVLLCTYPVRTGGRQAHHAAAVELPAGTPAAALGALETLLAQDEEHREGAAHARAALLARSSGRAVRFPGQELLRGRLTVERVLATGAVDRVDPLGGVPAGPETVLDTRDFVRPVLRDGALVLEVTPAAGGTLIPMELEHQHVCGH